MVEHLLARSLLVVSAQCIIRNRDLTHFSALHTDSFALTFLGSEFVKTFFLLPVEFSRIPGHFSW